MSRLENQKHLVIIGGSAEARTLARAVPQAHVWLSQSERVPAQWPGEVASLNFDLSDLQARLEHVSAVVDASHPCDTFSAAAVFAATDMTGVPLLKFIRPEWRATRRDRWVKLMRETDAAKVVARGSRVLLATGHQGLSGFANLQDCYLYARKLSPENGPFPLPNGRYLTAPAPFTVLEEKQLMKRLGINWIILRNAGGPGGWPKLAAARELGVNVALLRRPVHAAKHRIATIAGAVSWLKRHQR